MGFLIVSQLNTLSTVSLAIVVLFLLILLFDGVIITPFYELPDGVVLLLLRSYDEVVFFVMMAMV